MHTFGVVVAEEVEVVASVVVISPALVSTPVFVVTILLPSVLLELKVENSVMVLEVKLKSPLLVDCVSYSAFEFVSMLSAACVVD
jgi:hypothetical protein